MAQLFPIDFLSTIIKGMLIGILASAPMGPVGVLCVQRTINKGRWYGFVTGLGATASDLIYAILTGLGMSVVMDFINDPTTLYILKITGSAILLIFGVICFRSNPTHNMHISGNKKGSYLHNAVTAFFITLSNPLIIFLFMGTFAQFAFIIPNQPVHIALGYLAIVGGAILWWYGLTWLIDIIREKFDTSGIVIINKIIGSLVIVFSVVILIGTIFNLYSIY